MVFLLLSACRPVISEPGVTLGQDVASETLGQLTWVPPGSFQFGAPRKPGGMQDPEEVFAHPVTLTRGFWVMEKEVTRAQWRAVLGSIPSVPDTLVGTGDDVPVTGVSWRAAITFANAASARERLTPAYVIAGDDVKVIDGADGYRLPTEAQWEWAAGATAWAGTNEEAELCRFANVKDEVGAPCADGFLGLAPVGSLRPNERGLFDMSGNACEWVWDGFRRWGEGAQIDPVGPDTAELRIVRGCGYATVPWFARITARIGMGPDAASEDLGLRLIRGGPG